MSSLPSRLIRLIVINDLVCPYCYIDHLELLDALATISKSYPNVEFDIEHRPFKLISTKCLCEKKTVEKRKFYMSRLGEEKWTRTENAIGEWMQKKGVKISFGGVISQTISAHRLSRKAYGMGGQMKQLPILNGIFKAYAEEEKDIGDVHVLAQIAESAGLMSYDEAIPFLRSDELEQEVRSLAEEARANGVTGIPVTIIDGKWAVSGGQRADVYIQIFEKLATCSASNATSPTCSKTTSERFGPSIMETVK